MIRVKPKYCAICPIDDPEQTPGGIWIPDQAKDRTDQGIVKYVGSDCKYVEPLDYVIYGGWNGQLLKLDGEGRLIIMSEDFITARVSHNDIESLEIPDLFYRTRGNEYITATYETAIEFLTRAIGNSSIMQDKRKWDVRQVSEKSKPNQHREMKEMRDYSL